MNEELPDDFDVIVVGTGLTESVISGALSRIGKKVLHLDHLKNYGNDWSSYNLKGFETRLEESTQTYEDITSASAPGSYDDETEIFMPIKNIRKTVDYGEFACHLNDDKQEADDNSCCTSALDVKEENAVTQNDDDENSPAPDDSIKSAPIEEKEEGTNERENTQSRVEEVSESHQKVDEDSEVNKCNNKEEDKESQEESAKIIVEKLTENSGIIHKVEKANAKEVDKQSKEYFYSRWRHYNLDLTPKLMFSRGKLVELLIASNVCRYLEFRNVTGTLTLMAGSEPNNKLVPVPCSRTDIFNSKLVTMVEKRLLMRVLTTCANYENHPEEYKDYENRPFIDFLAYKKLSKKLQHFIIHSIAMVSEDTNTIEGLKTSSKFLKSLGRYGNSAFLWPTYGVGELPQAFCRLGAVFGGTFCLNRFVHGIVLSKETGRCVAVVDSTGQRLKCNHLIMNECYAPQSCRVNFANKIARAIYVTDSPFNQNASGNVSLIAIPPMANIPPSRFIEVGPPCCVCPSEVYVVHGMMKATEQDEKSPSPKSQFSEVENILFRGTGYRKATEETPVGDETDQSREKGSDKTHDNKKPSILWAAYFYLMSNGVESSSLPENVLIARGPTNELGFDETISEARLLFEAICPDDEFLPRAPNPEEIIYFDQNDEGYNTETNGTGNHTPDEIPGEYQEDENEVDCGSGEPAGIDESNLVHEN